MRINRSDTNFIDQLPLQPGVYRFYSKDDELLYVGKALSLRARVKSYFQKNQSTSPRISLMVAKIDYIEITVTVNEVSALILENNLIKSLKPKYNIIFRDDKTYLAIRITNHEFPRVESFRSKTLPKDGQVFGPYPNSYAAKQSIDTLQKIFKLRTCNDNFFNNRTRPCMLYQIKRCTAPCVNYISFEDYAKSIKLAAEFLFGNQTNIINQLQLQMEKESQLENFEKAASYRDQIKLIKELNTQQVVSTHTNTVNYDLMITKLEDEVAFIYLIAMRKGVYVWDKHFIVRNLIGEDLETITKQFLTSYYLDNPDKHSVVSNIALDKEFIQVFKEATGIKLIGEISKSLGDLYQMGEDNLEKIIQNYFNRTDLSKPALELAKLLKINELNKIECIDVSHHLGENTVASLVVFEDGIIDHTKYKRYNLNDTNGDDLLALSQVISRRLENSSNPFPQVFLIDGGINQYRIAKKLVINFELYGRIAVVAIFKGEKRKAKFDQIILGEGKILDPHQHQNVIKLLQALRDEAHRFAISGHRKKQIKKMEASALLDIPDVGSKKRKALINYFGSVKNISNATIDELRLVEGIGVKLANQIYGYFH